MKLRNTVIWPLIMLLISLSVFAAETPEQKGLRIAKMLEKKNNGFVGETSRMKMVLIDAHGTKTIREMKGMVLEINGDGDKSLIKFLNPKDVKGTKMLTWSHKSDDDDQWLYLPSLRRVKRISSKNKSASFMGSEFSYEDLGSQEVEKYQYKFIKDSKWDGHDIWLMERTPKKKSGYSKQIMYMSKKLNSALKIEYFDRKKELLKVATFSGHKQFKVNKKSLWRSNKIHMRNVQTKKQSIFSWHHRKLGVSHSSADFEKRTLK
jgi:outer membrane lipoprotein-sorting protein